MDQRELRLSLLKLCRGMTEEDEVKEEEDKVKTGDEIQGNNTTP